MDTDIIIIDSGIKRSHPSFKNLEFEGIGISNVNGNFKIVENFNDENGHGTAVAGIITSAVDNPKIFIVKIYNKELFVDQDLLIFALNYINEHILCKVIHMSLGTLLPNIKLENICNKLFNKGIVLVSAFDNAGGVSYPAAYNSVIGVEGSLNCKKANDFKYIDSNMINIFAKGGNHRVSWTNPDYTIIQGSSFSAAYVSAKVLKYLRNGISSKDILNSFKNEYGSIELKRNRKTFEKSLKIKVAALFPYNKEATSLLNFSDLLNFTLKSICNTKYLGNIGKTIKSLDQKREFIIEDIENFDWTSIDTFILGHCDKIVQYTSFNYKKYILDKCLEYNINLYSFDNIDLDGYSQKFQKQNLKLFVPGNSLEVEKNKLGKLYTLCTPVLGIFGTSSMQGKFTLQLMLRKIFKQNNYNIGQLGTEPSSLLFGMDAVYPFGYNSTVKLKEYEAIETLNSIMHRIDQKNYDIILAGSQSGTIPVCFNNIAYLNISQLVFLLGINPDAVILCVNTYDSIEYIQRTINVIENLVNCPVISLAVSVMGFPSDIYIANQKKVPLEREHLVKFSHSLEQQLNKKTYIIGDFEQTRQLYFECINFFSDDNE